MSFQLDDSPSGDAAGAGFSEAVDRGYTDFLTASGHNVTRIETSGNPDVSALNGYDLVILSRSNPSGNFRNDAGILWHSVTAPTPYSKRLFDSKQPLRIDRRVHNG